MPARKNKPGKFGSTPKSLSYSAPFREFIANKVLQERMADIKATLALALLAQESQRPGEAHYVGWPQMADALFLEKLGYLQESRTAKGCFHVTEKFKEWVEGMETEMKKNKKPEREERCPRCGHAFHSTRRCPDETMNEYSCRCRG